MEDIEKYKDLLNHTGGEDLNDEMADFLRKSATAQIPEGKGKAAIWDQIESSIDQSPTKVRRLNPWLISGVAAAITLIAAFVLTFSDDGSARKIEVLATSDENLTHDLPDGSQVQINSASSITYSESWDRVVVLSGEAFFEVTEGDKFTVETAFGNVEVLGTSFNVLAQDSTFEVSCKTGRVRVSVPSLGLMEELTPGKKILTKVDTIVRATLTKEEIGNWTSGEFYFNNRPIRDVFAEVERQYQTEIEMLDGDTLRFTGYFFKDSDLESTLDLICLPLGLSFEKRGSRYSISAPKEEL